MRTNKLGDDLTSNFLFFFTGGVGNLLLWSVCSTSDSTVHKIHKAKCINKIHAMLNDSCYQKNTKHSVNILLRAEVRALMFYVFPIIYRFWL